MSSYCLHFAFLVKTGEDRLSFFFSFGQEGVVKQILYDVGEGGGGLKKFAPWKTILCSPAAYIMNAALSMG